MNAAAGWQTRRLRYLARLNPPPGRLEGEIAFAPMSAVREGGGIGFDQTISAQDASTGLSYFEEGDVVLAKITPCFENGKCALARGIPGGRALGTTELHVLRPKSLLLPEFLLYSCLSDRFRRLGEASMSGAAGQKRVSREFLADFPVQFPERAAQQRIVDSLDRRTAQIDDLISKKHRLIGLLEEKRVGSTSRSVTQGLDPTVAMKDSRIAWLGPVPAHWEEHRLLELATFASGSTPSIERLDYWDGAVLLVVRGMILAHSLPVAVSLVALTINQDMKALQVRPNCSPEFLMRWFQGAKHGIAALIEPSAHGTRCLRFDLLKGVRCFLPARSEQDRICQHITAETAKLQEATRAITEAIEKLREYRAALITAAVTGQLDLRKHEKQMEAIA
jgi:type I restriction enzyme S subunit